MLLRDTPILDPHLHDEATRVARLLTDFRDPESLVVALNGPEGVGKTSCAQSIIEGLSLNGGCHLLVFNAWLFSRRGSLLEDFTRELMACLKVGNSGVWRSMMEYAVVLVTKSPRKPGMVWEARARLVNALGCYGRRTIVFMDDIDRLTATEIRDIFWLVKTVGALPTVHYVLVFDREVVVETLNELFPGRAYAYLASIVDVAVDIPLPDRDCVWDVLQGLVASSPRGEAWPAAVRELWDAGLYRLVPTMKHAKLLAVAIRTSRLGADEDLRTVITVESLRVLAQAVFDYVRRNLQAFLGRSRPEIPYHDLGVRDADIPAVEVLLEAVFPHRLTGGPSPRPEAARKYFCVG